MDIRQAQEYKWAKDISDFKQHMENIKRVGGLGKNAKRDRIAVGEYKCPSCRGALAPGLFRCGGIKFDNFGVKDVCERCKAGFEHTAFKCRRCLREYPSGEIIGKRNYFFMNPKIKIKA